MFREMRRSKQELPRQETEAILRRGTSGVLAVAGEDGWPYAAMCTTAGSSISTAPLRGTSWMPSGGTKRRPFA